MISSLRQVVVARASLEWQVIFPELRGDLTYSQHIYGDNGAQNSTCIEIDTCDSHSSTDKGSHQEPFREQTSQPSDRRSTFSIDSFEDVELANGTFFSNCSQFNESIIKCDQHQEKG